MEFRVPLSVRDALRFHRDNSDRCGLCMLWCYVLGSSVEGSSASRASRGASYASDGRPCIWYYELLLTHRTDANAVVGEVGVVDEYLRGFHDSPRRQSNHR